MMKKFWTVFVCSFFILAAVLYISMNVFASGKENFLEGSSTEDGTLRIYCADIVSEEETTEGCAVSLGGCELTVLSVESVKVQHIPITYYCLADVSGSMGADQMNQVKEALLAVIDGMKDGDNMVVGTLGNQTQTSGFITDKEELHQTIEALEAGREDTNLYAGIVESIHVLQTNAEVNPRKCLIILSDGEDDQKTGITEKEAGTAVEESSIPVYTVAALRNAEDEEAISYAKLLGSFARMSTGGAHFAPILDDSTGKEAGQAIITAMESGFVVSAELPETLPDKEEVQLRMVYTAEDNTVYDDILMIYTEDLKIESNSEPTPASELTPTPESTPESIPDSIPEPNPEPNPEPTPAPVPESSTFPELLPWLIGGAAALIIILVIVFTNKKHKKSLQEEQNEGKAEPASYEKLSTKSINQPESRVTESIPVYELRLYAIGYNEIVHTIQMEEGKEMTIGRNSKADIILDSEDKKLSSVHCRMQWSSGKLYVQDANSTNGTFVNGVPIKSMGRVVVHEGEIVGMGSYEYRVGRR